MSLLYKDIKDQTITADIKYTCVNNTIHLEFYADCGKHGTSEALDSFKLTPERLLQILQEREDLTDDEN